MGRIEFGSIESDVRFLNPMKEFAEVSTTEHNICVFQKISEDSRKWDNFHKFSVSNINGS